MTHQISTTQPRAEIEALGERIAEHAAHLDAATHRLLTDLRCFDAAGGWHTQGARSCAEWLSWRVGWTGNTAREHVRVAQRLGDLPNIDDALRRGELSYAKVRAMTRVATQANEATLLDDARHATGNQLELICRKYAPFVRVEHATESDDRRWRRASKRELEDGTTQITIRLQADEAEIVWQSLNVAAKECARDRLNESVTDEAPSSTAASARPGFSRVDGLVAMAQGVLRGDRPHRSPTEVVVTVASDALDGSNPGAAPIAVIGDDTCISVEAARRLACDSGIVTITEDHDGRILSVGRKTRSIPASIKRALMKRDRTCRFPGCQNRLFVEGHHIEHWATGGETSLGNLVCLCGYHHRFLHEYGYRVELADQGDVQFYDPRGRVVREVPEPARLPGLGMPAIRALNAELDITPETPACGWDGTALDYGWIVDDLLRADGSL